MEVHFVHLRGAGTGQAPLPATGAPGPASEPPPRPSTTPVAFWFVPPQLQPRRETAGLTGSAGRAAPTGQGMRTRAAVSRCGDTERGLEHHSSSKLPSKSQLQLDYLRAFVLNVLASASTL